VDFEWDEAKRRRVLAARGLDFLDARRVFDGRPVLTLASPRNPEPRWLTVGEIDGVVVAVVWTEREDRIRIITMRRARHEEERAYRSHFGARDR
jgi:uncharacterized protein